MHISIKTPIECRILHEEKKYAGQPFRKRYQIIGAHFEFVLCSEIQKLAL
jgi:hypothetical protein